MFFSHHLSDSEVLQSSAGGVIIPSREAEIQAQRCEIFHSQHTAGICTQDFSDLSSYVLPTLFTVWLLETCLASTVFPVP